MKRLLGLAGSLAIGLACAPASALELEEGGYYGVNYAWSDYTVDSTSSEASTNPRALSVYFGKNLNSYLAAEGRWSVGLGTDSLNGQKFQLDHVLGAYLRAHNTYRDRYQVYALLGISTFKTYTQRNLVNAGNSETDMSYGIGAGYRFGERASVVLEMTNIYSDSFGTTDIDLFTYSLGYQARF